jgi:hypothetical protein
VERGAHRVRRLGEQPRGLAAPPRARAPSAGSRARRRGRAPRPARARARPAVGADGHGGRRRPPQRRTTAAALPAAGARAAAPALAGKSPAGLSLASWGLGGGARRRTCRHPRTVARPTRVPKPARRRDAEG